MAKYDVAIIGAGLGGLQCAYILAKEGKKVCVVEQNRLLGGCLQSFKRKGKTLDTGFHYVGGLDDGQPLNLLFKYFDLLNLPWQRLDQDSFDKVVYNEKDYFYCNGYDNFARRMTDYFPKQKQEINQYVKFLEEVGNGIFSRFKNAGDESKNITDDVLFSTSAYSFLKEKISDPTLLNVLSGTALKLQLDKEKLPLYVFAQISSSYIQSAWRLRGGGMQIAEHLAQSIKSFGGEIFIGIKAKKFIENNGKISALETDDGQIIEADNFVSNIHPAETVNMGAETSFFRKIYRTRINNLQNGYGMFTANILLKPNKLEYQKRNIYIHKTNDLWEEQNLINSPNPICALVSYAVPEINEQFAENIDLLCPMNYADVEKFVGTKVGARGVEYQQIKAEKAEKLVDMVSDYVPNLKENIDTIYTSTPLTYADYTSTKNGAAYGIVKDCNKLMYTLLTPKTPAPNLYLTGQNLSLHGILGVSMTSFFTCNEILGKIPENIF